MGHPLLSVLVTCWYQHAFKLFWSHCCKKIKYFSKNIIYLKIKRMNNYDIIYLFKQDDGDVTIHPFAKIAGPHHGVQSCCAGFAAASGQTSCAL